MKICLPLLFSLALFALTGCGARFSKALPEPVPEPPAAAPAVYVPALTITPAQSPLVVERGTPVEILLAVAWADSAFGAVQLTIDPATPRWLMAVLPSDSLTLPASVPLRLETAPGNGLPGPATLVLGVHGAGLDSVLHVALPVLLRRVRGAFTAVQGHAFSQPCSTLCGRVDDRYQLDFYDLAAVPGLPCAGERMLPESLRVGGRTFPLAERGFGYSPGCGLAVVWEGSGALSLVNLGLSRSLPRGAVLTTLRGGTDVWLSPDNTVAVIRFSELLVPFDVTTGRQLGSPCGIDESPAPPILTADSLHAGPCAWQIY